jgi:hypothetical protein
MEYALWRMKTWFVAIGAIVIGLLSVFVLWPNNPHETIVAVSRETDFEFDQYEIAILQHDGTTWPFTQEQYERMPRTGVSTLHRDLILRGFQRDADLQRQHWNHPTTVHHGLLHVTDSNANFFYAFYQVMCNNGKVVVTLDALPRNSLNPNSGTTFDVSELYATLKQADPWFPQQVACTDGTTSQ